MQTDYKDYLELVPKARGIFNLCHFGVAWLFTVVGYKVSARRPRLLRNDGLTVELRHAQGRFKLPLR